jgi:tetratricopeptide (TPR) repeat protein
LMDHLKRAKDLELAGDLLGAAGALQAALSLAPDRAEIHEQYERVSREVTRALADNYEKQARYEEKMGKWPAAAASWSRVADGRPEDTAAASAAAEALLKAGGDLHRAQKYAQRANELAPNTVSHMVLLARVYLAAGLRLNATRELEKAVKLDPRDEMIKNLLNEAR